MQRGRAVTVIVLWGTGGADRIDEPVEKHQYTAAGRGKAYSSKSSNMTGEFRQQAKKSKPRQKATAQGDQRSRQRPPVFQQDGNSRRGNRQDRRKQRQKRKNSGQLLL